MKYSVVVPFHDEEKNVTEVYVQTRAVMEATADNFEFIFVDDGSADRTAKLLDDIAEIDGRVTVVHLRRNYGKTEALVAGFDQASGDYIVAMDGDLQHDPQEIPLFMEKLDEGYDMVCGCRVARPGDSVIAKQIPSRIANWLMAKASGVAIHDFGGGFKAFRADLIREIPLYGELQRFIPALASAYGARICEVPIEIAKRKHGKSHYGIGRLGPVIFDLLTIPFLLRYASRPMHFFGKLGLLGLLGAFGIAAWLAFDWIVLGTSLMKEHGPLMMFTGFLMVAALQLICLGFVGEMMARQYHRSAVGRRESEVLRITHHKSS
ncbi:MAG: glycosyltransferase family 2 protein [Bryobacteraceae bacterium]